MENMMKDAVDKIVNAFSGPYSGFGNYCAEEDHFSSVPEISDVDTVADKVVAKSNIIIFTGMVINNEI